ncbi:MAG TPA: ADP-ribosylglycohydrolase family protein [Firmicutes bacterium]|nr:ADP-ribosylglycohydrolase family protein [Bacillota bacterium]
MWGAILGDIVGSAYERPGAALGGDGLDFPLFTPESRFTDDTVLTVATADALLRREGRMAEGAAKTDGPEEAERAASPPPKPAGHAAEPVPSPRPASGAPEGTPPSLMPAPADAAEQYAKIYKQYYFRYPYAGYGELFRVWCLMPGLVAQESYGNGGAMRVCPIGYAAATAEQAMEEAALSCRYTHRHPEGTAGAQAVALAVFLAREGCSKAELAARLSRRFGYDLSRPLRDIRPGFAFDARAAYTVPPALRAFLESDDVESAIRLAVSLGGDSDTLACMAGGVAEAYYGPLPVSLRQQTAARLDAPLRAVAEAFSARFLPPAGVRDGK